MIAFQHTSEIILLFMRSATIDDRIWRHFCFKENTDVCQLNRIHLYYCLSLKTNVISTSKEQSFSISSSVIYVIQIWINQFVHYFDPEMLSYRNGSPLMTFVLIRYVVSRNGVTWHHLASYFNTNAIRLQINLW